MAFKVTSAAWGISGNVALTGGDLFFFLATFEVLQPQRTQWETEWRRDSHQETGSQTSSLRVLRSSPWAPYFTSLSLPLYIAKLLQACLLKQDSVYPLHRAICDSKVTCRKALVPGLTYIYM